MRLRTATRMPCAIPLARPDGVRDAEPTASAAVARASRRRSARRSARCPAYPVAKATGMIKLDAMENPYGLSGEARAEIAAAVANVADQPLSRRRRRRREGGAAPARSRCPTTSRSCSATARTRLLQMLTAAVAKPGAVVLAPDPSFVLYRTIAELANLRYVGVPLRADLTLDIDAMLAAIAREQAGAGLARVPEQPDRHAVPGARRRADHPRRARASSPSTRRTTRSPTRRSCRACSSSRTWSSCARCPRSGMAGVRLGYAAAHPAWIAELDKVRPPYNVNSLTQAVVPVLLRHADAAGRAGGGDPPRARARGRRARRAAARRPCSRRTPISCSCACPDAAHWFATLREAGILVKNVNGWHPLLANCLRITIGTPAENNALLDALRATLRPDRAA